MLKYFYIRDYDYLKEEGGVVIARIVEQKVEIGLPEPHIEYLKIVIFEMIGVNIEVYDVGIYVNFLLNYLANKSIEADEEEKAIIDDLIKFFSNFKGEVVFFQNIKRDNYGE